MLFHLRCFQVNEGKPELAAYWPLHSASFLRAMHDIAIPDLGILESLQAWPMAKRQTGSSEDPDTDQIRKALLCKRVTF
eukprot:s1381_g3.t1